MTNQSSEFTNNYEDTVATELSAVGTSLVVNDASGLAVPCFLTLDYDDPAKLEIVRVTAKVTNTLTVTRYLAGSAAGSGLTHLVGATVKEGVVAQMFEDLHDRLEAHDHSGGAQGTTVSVDHGATTGLTDDDHTQYLKEKANGGLASEVPTHTHASAAEAGQFDHGAAAGLGDDDHNIYLLATGARALSGDLSMGTNKLTDLAAPTADNDAARKKYVDDAVGAGSDRVLGAYKSADQTRNNTTTLADDSVLSVTLEANHTYRVELFVLLRSATTPDFKFDFSNPSGTTGLLRYATATAASTYSTWTTHALDTPTSFVTTDVDRHLVVEGFIRTTSAGTFAFEWAQNISNAGNTTVKALSSMVLTKIT